MFLPLIAERIKEFSIEQIIQLLKCASKPLVGKKSVLRILLGFACQGIDLLEKHDQKDAAYSSHVRNLKNLVTFVFRKEGYTEILDLRFNEQLKDWKTYCN